MNPTRRRATAAPPISLLALAATACLAASCAPPAGSSGSAPAPPQLETLRQYELSTCSLDEGDDIAITGASGTGGIFKKGDEVKVAVDTTGIDDGGAVTVTFVFVDLSDWGGNAVALALDDGGDCDTAADDDIWSVCHDTDDDLDVAAAVATVTITYTGGTTSCDGDPAAEEIDTTAPAPTQGNVAVSGDSGDNDTFVDGDAVVVVWDNSAADGDNITDLDGVTVDFSEFGGAASVDAVDDGSGDDVAANDDKWTATATVTGAAQDVTDANVVVTATDDAGNTGTADSADEKVDNEDPAPTQGAIALSGQGGANDTFVTGDTVTVVWDASAATGDNIADVTSVAVDLSEFGGGAAVVANDSGDAPDVVADDGKWSASAALYRDGQDESDRNVSITVTDDAGNTGAADSADHKIDTVDPAPTQDAISVTGHEGDNDTFVADDVVVVVWDNRAGAGDDIADAASVAMDLSAFGGGAAVAANDNGDAPDDTADDDKWTASATVAGARDVTDAAATVTVTDDAGNTGTADSVDEKVDTTAPTVTAGNISVTNATDAGAPFQDGDVAKIEWDDSAGGDNNTDTLSTRTVDLTGFGGDPDVSLADDDSNDSGACTDTAAGDGKWTACVTVGGTIDVTDAAATVSVTDDAGNVTETASADQTVDTVAPAPTQAKIALSGQGGTNDTFVTGDTVTVVWDASAATGDDIADVDAVAVDLSEFGGGAAVAATDDGVAPDVTPNDDKWTASAALDLAGQDVTDRNVTVTVTDDGTNTGTADSADHKADTVDPAPTAGAVATDGANGDDGSFVDTDVVRAVWDNSAATGDNQTDLAASNPVTVNFGEFGGGAAVVAVDDGTTPIAGCTDDASGDDKWTACADVSGAREVADANVVVTATDDAGNTGAANGVDQDVDTTAPTVTAGNIAVTNATDDGAPLQDGDVAKIEWDDSAGGDNNTDTLSARTVDLSDFGGGAAVSLADDDSNDSGACTDTAAGDGKWTACVTIAGTIDVTDAVAAVAATDDAGNVTTTSSANQTIDTVDPAPTQAKIALSGQGGTNDTFVDGDTVTVVWDASAATGDDIADVDSVAVDLSEFGGGAAVAANDSGDDPDVTPNDDKWTASAAIAGAGRDGGDRNVTVTVTDDGTNTGAADSADHKVDTIDPAPTTGAIATDGATGDGGSFVDGDVVRAVWDNSAATGDDQSDLAASDPVSVDFGEFGGAAAVVAVDDGSTPVAGCTDDASGDDKWTACAAVDGALQADDANVVVTATDDAGNTGAADGAAQNVDTTAPTVTAASIIVCGDGGDGIFVAGDTVTVLWDNRASGDNNGDLQADTPVQVNFFDIAGQDAVDAVANREACNLAADAQRWVASYELAADDLDATEQNVAVTATDDAGNDTTTTDTGDLNVDTTTPTVTDGAVHVCGADADDLFRATDEITVVWDNRASGDNNPDLHATDPVTVDMFGIAGATAVVATASTVSDCAGLPSHADVWVATYTVAADDLDDNNVSVTVSVKDDGEQTIDLDDSGAFDVDAVDPTVSGGAITVCGDTDGLFKAGDTVTVDWDNGGGGDRNDDLRAADPVSVNFFGISGSTAVLAANDTAGCAAADANLWVATYTLQDDDLDDGAIAVQVSATDDGKNTTTTGDDTDYNVDTAEPVVTAGAIHLCGDTAGLFKAGETVTVAWDNRSSGDDNPDLNAADPVTVDMFGIAGATAVVASNNRDPGCDGLPSHADVWVATHVLATDTLDDTGQVVRVSATDHADHTTTTADTEEVHVDTVKISISAGAIHVCGDTDGVFQSGDTVTVAWDNTAATGDNNVDLKASNPVKVNFFGISGATSVNAAADTDPAGCGGLAQDAQVWVATHVLADDTLDDSSVKVVLKIRDDANQQTQKTDDTAFSVDTTEPVVSTGAIHICGDTGTGGAFKVGDTVVVAWDNTAGADDNDDLNASEPVSVDVFGLDGADAVVAQAGVDPVCAGLAASADMWVATYQLPEGAMDATGQVATVSVTDDSGYTTTTVDDTGRTVDIVRPTVQAADVQMDTADADGTDDFFKVGNRVRVEWVGDDNPADEIVALAVDLTGFGGGGAQAARDDGATVAGCADDGDEDRTWTACHTVTEGDPETASVQLSVTATDNAGNTAAATDAQGYGVDGVSPTVDLGAHGEFAYGEGVDITFDPAYTQGHIYDWVFGDGGTASGQGASNRNPTHSFDDQDTYTVEVVVTDDHGNTSATVSAATDTRDFVISNQNPAPVPQSVSDLGDDGVAGGDDDALVSGGRAIEAIDPRALFTVRNTTDPSPVDVTSLDYIWDWGDGESFAFGAGGAADAEYTGVDVDSCSGYAACQATVGCSDYDSCKLAVEHNFFQGQTIPIHTVTLTAVDKDDGTDSAEFSLQVTDVVPDPRSEAQVAAMDEADGDAPVRVRGWVDNPVANAFYTFTFDWKDGAVDQVGPVPWNGVDDPEAVLSHRYDDDPSEGSVYAVTVSVESHTNVANSAADLDLTVNNLDPTAAGRELVGQTAVEGEAAHFEAVFDDDDVDDSSDPSPFDTLTFEWDYDAPGACAGLAEGALCGGFEADTAGASTSHTYSNDGTYLVCVRATDDDGGRDDDCFEVEVDNVAPVALPPADKLDAVEGIAFSLEGGGTDVDADSIDAYEWDLPGCAIIGAPDATATFVCADNGAYIGTLRVDDGDVGGLGDPAEFTVFVANVAPNAKACVGVNPDNAPAALDFDAFQHAGCQQVSEIDVFENAQTVFLAAAVDRGDVGDLTTATGDDVAPNELLYTWNMGDGALPLTGKRITHTFSRVQDRYPVELVVQDKDGGRAVVAIVVNVLNVAPRAGDLDEQGDFQEGALELLTPADARVEGSKIWFRGAGSDTPGDDLSYIWTAWRDVGQSCAEVQGRQPLAQQSGFNLADVGFTFGDNGDYLVCLVVRDEAQEDSAPASGQVTIANVDPTASAGEERVATEGEAIVLEGAGQDPGADEGLTYHWEFGDCLEETAQGRPAFDSSGRSEAHVYVNEILPAGCDDPFDEGFLATLTVRDKDGGEDEDTVRILVANVSPTMPLLPRVPVTEGVAATVFPAGFSLVASDPGDADTLTYVFGWGDGTADSDPIRRGPDEAQGRGVGVAADHTYAQDGQYNGRVCVADDAAQPGRSCRDFTVLVANDRPTIVPAVALDGRAVRGEAGVRQSAEFDQGVDNCLPVLVQDTGLDDHPGTSCEITNSPQGVTIQATDIGASAFPADGLALAAHEHVPCWLCWNPPESAITEDDDPNPQRFTVRVQVRDNQSFVTQDWSLVVRNTDDDDDVMPNTYELSYPCFEPGLRQGEEGCTPCLDAQANDAADDPDGDGVTNLQEYERGSEPCASDTPSAPAVVAPVDGGQIRQRPALLVVSNAFDPNAGAVFVDHRDLEPLRYLFVVQEGLEAPRAPTFEEVGRAGCEADGALPGAQVTRWEIDLPGDLDLQEDTHYSWGAWACDGFSIGPGTGGNFFFNEVDTPPTAPEMRAPAHLAEDQPIEPTFEWTCSGDDDEYGPVPVVEYELELRVLGETRPFLVQALPPCAPGEELGRFTLAGGLASDRWYEWTLTAIDPQGLRTGPTLRPRQEGEDEDPSPRWAFLVNPENHCPAAPILLSPTTPQVPPAGDRLPGLTVSEVATLTPELTFRAPLVPDADGNPVLYRVDIHTSETFAEEGRISSPPLEVAPNTVASWTVDGGMLADDTFYWWRALAVDGSCEGEAASTLIFTNTDSGPPVAGGAGQARDTDTRRPVIVADQPPPSDPDGDLFSCKFELVRMVGESAECLPRDGECGAGVCEFVDRAEGVPPEDGGAVAWRPDNPMQNGHPHCWRHLCCDADQLCGEWSEWFPLTVDGPNQCPSGIALIGPDSDDEFDLNGQELLGLVVQNADDSDGDTALSYEFEVYADSHLSTEHKVIARAIEEGVEGRTRLEFPQGGDAMTALRLAMGGQAVATFHWRARATDGSACASAWTRVGRFTVARHVRGSAGCSTALGGRPLTDGAPWIVGLLAWAWSRRRGPAGEDR